MGYKVERSFDYADMLIDYKNKRVKIKYPYRMGKLSEFLLFFFIGIFPTLLASVFLSFLIAIPFMIAGKPALPMGRILYIPLFIVWMIICYKTDKIRKWFMESGMDSTDQTNQIYLGPLNKKEIRIKNMGNYFTQYETEGDHSKYLETFHIRCVRHRSKGNFWTRKLKYFWEIKIKFSKVPKKGHMIIYNVMGGNDEVNFNGGRVTVLER